MPKQCIQPIEQGVLCTNRAMKTGYCNDHDPEIRKKTQVALVEQKKKAIQKQVEKEAKQEQRQEIFAQQLSDMIAECQSLEDLRRLELKVLQALLDGTIQDPRVGSPVAQLLKHQEQLITKTKGGEDKLKEDDRARAISIAKEMTPEQMLGLLGDLAHGMKNLVKQTREEAAAITVTVDEVQDDAEDTDNQCEEGAE